MSKYSDVVFPESRCNLRLFVAGLKIARFLKLNFL